MLDVTFSIFSLCRLFTGVFVRVMSNVLFANRYMMPSITKMLSAEGFLPELL